MVRKACNLEPNVLSGVCPTRKVLDLIADKWTVLVIYLLAQKTFVQGITLTGMGGR